MTNCGRGRDSATDKLRAWEGLGHCGTFWARLSWDDFRSKLKIISIFPRLCSFRKVFSVSPCFCKIWRQTFGFNDVLELFLNFCLKLRSATGESFCELRLRPRDFFQNYLSLLKAEPVLLAGQLRWSPGWAKHFGDGMFKMRMKTSLPGIGEIELRRTIDRRRDWYASLALIHGPKEKKNTKKSACDCAKSQPFISTKPASFQEPVSTVLHFAVCVFMDVWLQVGQAAARGQRRKAVIRDIPGVRHRGIMNLGASIWFTAERHCTVFCHVTQLRLLVLCKNGTLTVILLKIKKKRSISNVGHRCTKAEHLTRHSTG